MFTVAAGAVWYLVALAVAAVVTALARGARRERPTDVYEALAASRFTIPASVVVAADGDREALAATVDALLTLNYPQFEVIVVSSDVTAVEALQSEWRLAAKELFYRRVLDTGPIDRFYASARDARLLVVECPPQSRADALNLGLNIARYRYVVSLTSGVAVDRDALLRLMSPALRDPAAVLAVTGDVEPRREAGGAATRAGGYGWLAWVRSWMAGSLAWNALGAGLPPRQGVIAWRRDALVQLGGFSRTAADPVVDMLLRLQSGTSGSAGRVVRTRELFGSGIVPLPWQQALAAARRGRSILQALPALAAGSPAGRSALASYVALELLPPVARILVLAAAIAGAAIGLMSWMAPLLALLMLAFGQAAVAASAVLLRGGIPAAPVGRDLLCALLRAPLESVMYWPMLARGRGTGAGAAGLARRS